MKRRTKVLLWTGVTAVALAGLGSVLWVRHFKTYTPVEVVLDVRAGIAARNAPKPVEKFMELRYGPLNDPANRQKAFIDFFNVGHIQGMHLLVERMPESRRQENIQGMAQWIANYRRTMTPAEKRALSEYVHSAEGRAAVQQATAQYLSHNVHYRAATASVIAELMTTLTAVKEP